MLKVEKWEACWVYWISSRFADILPETNTGIALSIADKLDSLADSAIGN